MDDWYLLAPDEGDYLSVRALTMRGSDEQIGAQLAELARRDYQTTLVPYADPVYSAARQVYLERNHPALAGRARGVAQVFGLGVQDTTADTTGLGYDLPARMGCSAVWFPGSLTTTGRPLIGRNQDWWLLRLSELAGLPRGAGEQPSYARSVMVTTVPDNGRAVLQLGCHDLLDPGCDGMNDAGLMMAALTDATGAGNTPVVAAGGYAHGLISTQLIGCVLSQATTVAEAKQVVLAQQIFVPTPDGQHWLIADAHGAATVLEIDRTTRQYRFVDAPGDAPFVLTNHALHTYSGIDTFPQVEASKEHNTFVRYQMLTEAIAAHRGRWSPEQINALLDGVLCAFVDATAAGIGSGLPVRTLWNYLADPADRSYHFRFHQHDLGPEPGTNHMRVQRTAPIEVRLDKILT